MCSIRHHPVFQHAFILFVWHFDKIHPNNKPNESNFFFKNLKIRYEQNHTFRVYIMQFLFHALTLFHSLHYKYVQGYAIINAIACVLQCIFILLRNLELLLLWTSNRKKKNYNCSIKFELSSFHLRAITVSRLPMLPNINNITEAIILNQKLYK